MATKAMSAMAVDSSIDGTERLLEQGSDGLVVLVSAIGAYTIDVLAAASTATPTTGDWLVGFRGTDEKRMTLDNVASYAITYAYSNASTASPALTGDSLLIQRSGTVYDMTVDTLVTYVLATTSAATSALQAGVLNISGLSTATLANTDILLVCQTTTGKKATIAALETLLWTDFASYVGGLTEVASITDSNKFYVLEGSTPKYVDADTLADYMSAEIIEIGNVQSAALDTLDTYLAALSAATSVNDTDLVYVTQSGTAAKMTVLQIVNHALDSAYGLPWKEIPPARYTATPASTSTITMSDTTGIAKGSPVKYVYGGLTYYGIVTSVNANALITIAGAPLVVISDISELYVGTADLVTQMDLIVDDLYGDAVQDLLSTLMNEYRRWGKSAAYLVQFSATHYSADTGAEQPKLNVKVNGSVVSTNDVSKGLQLSATPGTWTDSSAIAIDTATYKIERGEAIELRCTAAGTNADAALLSVTCIFVSE